MSNITLPTKHHRTLLVLDASEGFDSVVAERFSRILQSVGLNNEHPSIKVDVATLRPQSSSSLSLVPGAAFDNLDEDDEDFSEITIDDVKAAASEAGYDICWVASGLRD